MTKQRFTPAYPAELRERGVRLFRENRADYASDTAAYKAIAPKLGDLPPAGPSLMTRVCGFGLDSCRFRAGQARRARSPQIAQASGALRPVFCSRAMSVA